MNKVLLRKRYQNIRDNILDQETKSEIICQKIISLDEYKKAKVLAFYSKIKSEVDLNYLINYSLLNKKIVVLPKVIDDKKMEFYKIDSISNLEVGSFNILEPVNNLVIDNIDIMFIPGLCFDESFNRLGYGKGYYDYYLSNNDTIKIGIAFDEQILKNELIDSDSNDIKMNLIITDKKLYK